MPKSVMKMRKQDKKGGGYLEGCHTHQGKEAPGMPSYSGGYPSQQDGVGLKTDKQSGKNRDRSFKGGHSW